MGRINWDDWTRGGRRDSYEFACIPFTNGVRGMATRYLHNVVSCDITLDWETSARASGSIDVVDTAPVDNCYIRVTYTPQLYGEGACRRIVLGTFFAFTQSAEYENGAWNCTISLKSVLTRFTDDKLARHFVLSKGQSALSRFKYIVAVEYGGSYDIRGVADRKFTKTQVVEFGSTVYELLSKIAAVLNCAIDCDPHGYVVLEPKMAASNRPVSGEIPSGSKSVTLPGVSMEATWQTTPNRYAAYYHEEGEFEVFGLVCVKKSARNSKAHIGRYITEAETLNKLDYERTYSDAKVFTGDGSTKTFTVAHDVEELVRARVGGKTWKASASGRKVTFSKTPARNASILIEYEYLKPMATRLACAQTAITKVAKGKFAAKTATTANEYTFECFYLPLDVNRVYTFRQGGLAIDGIVKSIDYALRPEGMRMTVTMRKVRSR